MRLVTLTFLSLAGLGCRSDPTDAEQKSSKASSNVPSQQPESEATEERCSGRKRVRMITIQGEPLQRETEQTRECLGDECASHTHVLLKPRHFLGDTCAKVRRSLEDKPLVDAWGAQARVLCDGEVAQAVSMGRDGKFGTCDDVEMMFEVNARDLHPHRKLW